MYGLLEKLPHIDFTKNEIIQAKRIIEYEY